jgi:hypothetical protein
LLIPAGIDQSARLDVEVAFDRDLASIPKELEQLGQELLTLGPPEADTPAQRKQRVELLTKVLSVGPPLSDEDAEAILALNKRTLSLFTLNGEPEP